MREDIQKRSAGILSYGITPPKRSYTPEKRAEVAARQTARIAQLPVDGLVIYDLQDESARTSDERPFPFLPTIDPIEYAYDDLSSLALPKVCYRCVARLTEAELSHSLRRIAAENGLCTLVGAASRDQQTKTRLADAYALHRRAFPTVPLGAVLIAERHTQGRAEDERALRKLDQGVSFFVTQAVYSVVATKNVLSDLYYRAQQLQTPIPPILVTLSPCGSTKTLEFMRWLGISVPRWLENELTHAHDILQVSVELCLRVLNDLLEFCAPKGIPLGCNVESVSLRKAEIDASVELAQRARSLLGARPSPSI